MAHGEPDQLGPRLGRPRDRGRDDVVRAVETVAQPDGKVAPDEGWASLVVTPERGLWAIDGLLTGLHEPESSHLEILRAAAGESCSNAATTPRSSAAIAGTSSATATSSFPDLSMRTDHEPKEH